VPSATVPFHEQAAAHVLRAYLRRVARRSVYVAVDAAGTPLPVDGLAEHVGRFGERLIATYWIDNALPFATLSFANPGLLAFARRFRFLIDDTLGGRLSGHAIASVGGRYAMLALPGNPLRLKQVSAVMAESGSCIFPVDGGGPYREAGTGIIGLATALRASIVPLTVQGSRAVIYPHRSRLRVPLPGGRIVVGVGDPIAVGKETPRRAAAARVKEALDRLETVARAELSHRI
jgi:hypothetical protein